MRLQGRETKLVKALARWATDEHADFKHKSPRTVDTSAWPHHFPSAIPRQQNCFDCGVFALQASSDRPGCARVRMPAGMLLRRMHARPPEPLLNAPAAPWLVK